MKKMEVVEAIPILLAPFRVMYMTVPRVEKYGNASTASTSSPPFATRALVL
jgi:hypothetical protein